jgi:hypothetical protein
LFATAGDWLGKITILCAVVTAVAWLTKQPWRFRAFGVTAFLVVLTSGVWTLAIVPSIVRPKVSGAARYEPVYDRGGDRAVIAVKPDLSPETLEKTMRQALVDLGSPGRSLADTFTIQARTVVHPRPGVSRLVAVATLVRNTRDPKSEPQIRIDRRALAEARAIAERTPR